MVQWFNGRGWVGAWSLDGQAIAPGEIELFLGGSAGLGHYSWGGSPARGWAGTRRSAVSARELVSLITYYQ
jgi:hypothetical protein